MLESLADQGINVVASPKVLKDGKKYLKNYFNTHRDEVSIAMITARSTNYVNVIQGSSEGNVITNTAKNVSAAKV